jgi:hypothetical protein
MLITVVAGSVSILGSWVIFGLLLVGLGLAVQRLYGLSTFDVDH